MRLADYLTSRDLTLHRFAGLIGVSAETVRRYALPEGRAKSQVPRRPIMARIRAATGGLVGPQDFYDAPAAQHAEGPAP